MKRLKRASTLISSLNHGFTETRKSEFWHDRLSLGLVSISLIIVAITFILLLPIVRSGLPGAIRYSSLNGGYTLGAWYFPYAIASYATVIIVMNTILAVAAYRRSRLASFGLLIGELATAFFGLVIATALGAAR